MHLSPNGQLSQPRAAGQPDGLTATDVALGFDAIANWLAAHASSAAGARACLQLPWLGEREAVAQALARVDEAQRLASAGIGLPAGPPHDIGPQVAAAEKGAVLDGTELNQVAAVCAASENFRQFAHGERASWPALAALGQILSPLHALQQTLQEALHADGSLRDEASLALAEARAAAHALDARLREQMQAALQDPEVAPHLQDDFVSLRNGRYVLPVVASFQSKVPGIVHNASQTGQTLFIEPETMVAQGNALVVLRAKVAQEEARLLQLLSQEVAHERNAVDAAIDVLARLDVVLATASLASRHGWKAVRLGPPNGPLRLRGLRHPALQRAGAAVVANDVTVGGGGHGLVLSGPNAGGKTVTLRAIGLCVRMLQAGLPVPADADSEVPLAARLVVQVGDGQDVECGQSSFSAHLEGLRVALEAARAGTLVLLDEIGADTDPTEGTALAQAVLCALADAGAQVVATTHLLGLKALAQLDGRFANARMVLDPDTLRPTHRLQMGTAGSSHALAIAERVGLPTAVLARARGLLQGGEGQLGAALQKLEHAQQEAEAAGLALARERAALAEARARLAAEADARATEREAERRQDQRTLAHALDEAAATLARHLQAAAEGPGAAGQGQAQRAAWQREAAKARTAAGPASRAGAPEVQPALAAPSARAGGALPAGTKVWLTTLARSGELVGIDGQTAVVALGGMRTRVPAGTVRPLAKQAQGQAPAAGTRPTTQLVRAAPADAPAAHGRCDVRGLRAEQAEATLVRAIDNCLSDGEGVLWVVHGHGTGALRDVVRRHLAQSPYVADARPGAAHEGGDGVTVVRFAGE